MRSAAGHPYGSLLLGTAIGCRRRVRSRFVRFGCGRTGKHAGRSGSRRAAHSTACSVLHNPDRIVLDVAGSRLAAAPALRAAAGVVKQVRMGRRPSGELRIVFDLSRSMRAKSFVARAEQSIRLSTGHRLGQRGRAPIHPSKRDMPAPMPATSSSPSMPAMAARIPAPSARTARVRRTWCSPSRAHWRSVSMQSRE